ncbi:DNA binding protein 2 [Orgyia leucostigma nucleopolyhedrovirus]|uniref:DNA binding protein 2 n=1 Tax=Orgyia leucostigma nucleopolyhedrovirus TaxID=490711 RepID=B0FDS1_9ABAC|nr:DNA binding protein 2 [Orgyia leucostigma nucleopolyhedrovirus]ABY65779.1 DNA binding protein 2 [Orgyia leucostigma nucleopolyhedrovirus]
MSKRRSSSDDNSEDVRLSVYNGVEISEISNADEELSLAAQKAMHDRLLCDFTQVVKKPKVEYTWYDELLYNLRIGNYSVVRNETDDLNDLLASIQNKLNLDENWNKMYPKPDTRISIEKAKPPHVVNHIGYRVHGGLMPFYFCDEVTLKFCVGKHGPFMKIFWSKMSAHNRMMANIIICYNGWKGQIIKMQDDVLINIPYNDVNAFVKKFFKISRQRNADIFEKGIKACEKPLMCDTFSEENFNDLFSVNAEESACKPSVKMIMYAELEGYKVGKEKELESVYCQKITEKPYSLAVQPLCFFYVQNEEIDKMLLSK